MIVCPNCNQANLAGAIFCAECGNQLAGGDSLTTQTIRKGDFKVVGREQETELYQSFDGSGAWGSLHLMDTGQVLPLSPGNEFTLGRVSEGQPIMPDIDLSPYQAYAAGVSRLHAVIKRREDRLVIMDLGSANGSYLNGERLPVDVEQPLRHGDVVLLGKLRIQILLKEK
jgi:hypothetical protein